MPDASSPDFRPTLVRHAMAATFKVTLVHAAAAYARQAGAAALAELDRIEARLSRYVEASDISRINVLARGQETVVQLDTFECLRIALDVQRETGGAFDVAYASRGDRPAGPRFELNADTHAVRVLGDGVRLDLGGIGKGFALDRMAAILADWEIPAALLAASTSTLLAVGSPPGEEGWPIAFGPEKEPPRAGFPLTLEIHSAALPKRSWVKTSQIRTLSVDRLGKRLGRVSPEELTRVIDGLLEIVGD